MITLLHACSENRLRYFKGKNQSTSSCKVCEHFPVIMETDIGVLDVNSGASCFACPVGYGYYQCKEF